MSTETLLNVVLVDGPKDGLKLAVPIYQDELLVHDGLFRWHLYEFDPVTDRRGRWVYRYRGTATREGGAR